MVVVVFESMEGFGETNKVGLSDLRKSITEAFLFALETKDLGTASHSKRVHDIAKKIAVALSLHKNKIEEIELAGLLHDVGKIQVPDRILLKPSTLSAHERLIIEKHSEWGFEIVKQINGLETEATMLRYHHERWDGKGYSHGLRGDEIPLGSRVISVADAYDAMVSDRPYRLAMSHDIAVERIMNASETQFDPAVVEAFLMIQDDMRDALSIQKRSESFLALD